MSPQVCTTPAIPGRNAGSPAAVAISSRTTSQPARQRPPSRRRDAAAAALGCLTQQDAAFAFEVTKRGQERGVVVRSEAFQSLETLRPIWQQIVQGHGAANGFTQTADNEILIGADVARDKIEAAFAESALDVEVVEVQLETFYLENDWTEQPDGQSYLERASLGRDLQEAQRDLIHRGRRVQGALERILQDEGLREPAAHR